jgi:hypothetical protein
MSDSSVEAALEIRDFLDTLLLIAKHDRAPMRALAPRSKPARSCRITSIRPIGMTHPPTGRDRAEGEGQEPDWIKTVSPSGELSADPRVGLSAHLDPKGGTEMSDRTMLEPTPELPDDTLISGVEFPARIRTVLAIAGLETVGEVRETSDEILLSFQDFGKASIAHLRQTLGLPSTDGDDLLICSPPGRVLCVCAVPAMAVGEWDA